jgi:hypothetical protein
MATLYVENVPEELYELSADELVNVTARLPLKSFPCWKRISLRKGN